MPFVEPPTKLLEESSVSRRSAQSAIPAVVPVVGAVKFMTAPPEKVKFRRRAGSRRQNDRYPKEAGVRAKD